MKTLIKWFVKRYVTVEAIKGYIHSANAALKEKAVLDGGKEKVVSAVNDVTALAGEYLKAYADDGKITDDEELAAIDAKCDEMIGKYLSDGMVDGLLDKVFS